MTSFRHALLAVMLALCAPSLRGASTDSSGAAENWAQWRGPSGAGVAAAGDFPTEFSGDKNVAWKVKLPGRGSSTPAVWGDSIFVTAGVDGENGLICYGFDGKEKWRKTFGAEVPGKHLNGSGSNPSPVTDGEHLIVYYKSADLVCLGLDGKVLWQTNLAKEYGDIELWWDLGNTPLIHEDLVIVPVMHGGESYLVALKLESGVEAWRTSRQYERPQETDQSYTSPAFAHVGGKDVVVTFGADHLTGHDPSTGKLRWDFDGFNPQNQAMWRVISSPVIVGDVAVVPYARGGAIAAVRIPPGETTAPSEENRLWDKPGLGADVPTPAVVDGKVVLLGDAGQITCLGLESGGELWTAKLPKARDKFYASPIVAGDLLYTIREDGAVFVGRITEAGYEKLSESKMGERVIATPVPIRGGLLVRGEDHLFWID